MKKNKKNIFLYVIIVLLLIVVIVMGFLLLKEDKTINEDNSNNDVGVQDSDIDNAIDEDNNEEDIVDYSKNNDKDVQPVVYCRDELFTKLSGIWRYVDDSGVNYAFRVYVDEVGADRVSIGQYGTGIGIFGKLTDVSYKSDSIYQLTLFSVGCHGNECLEESDDITYYVDVDISDIDNNQVKVTVNNMTNTYSYIAKTWDEAENSFSY